MPNPIRELLEEMWSDWGIAQEYALEKKENWTPIYCYLARLFLLTGVARGLLMGCEWGYLLWVVIKH